MSADQIPGHPAERCGGCRLASHCPSHIAPRSCWLNLSLITVPPPLVTAASANPILNRPAHRSQVWNATALGLPFHWWRSGGLWEAEAPRISWQPAVFTPRKIPGPYFCYGLSLPQGHSATERVKSLKNSSDPIGNRNRNLPACSAVPQPTASLPT
jgi:hypothetical protein